MTEILEKIKTTNKLVVLDPTTNSIAFIVPNKKNLLKQLQQLVDGLIGVYYIKFENKIVLVDEEGLLKNKSFNHITSNLLNFNDIVGTAVLIDERDFT